MDHLRARKIAEKEGRRQAILAAARGLFASQGISATTVEQIAFSCKLSRSLIYTYFVDKNHLFYVLVSEALKLMLEDFDKAVATKASGLDRITEIGWAYVRFALSKPEYFEVISLFQFSQAPMFEAKVKGEIGLTEVFASDIGQLLGRAHQINQCMATTIKEGISDGSIRPDAGDPMQVALSLWAITGGLIQTTQANKDVFAKAYGISQDSIIERGLSLAREGLKNKEDQS